MAIKRAGDNYLGKSIDKGDYKMPHDCRLFLANYSVATYLLALSICEYDGRDEVSVKHYREDIRLCRGLRFA